MKDDRLHLERMRGAIKKIKKYTGAMSEVDFFNDDMRQSAVILQLILLGEMAKKLSIETKAQIPLPWRQITGFRDRGIHDYFEMDLGIIWQAAIVDVYVVDQAIQHFLDAYAPN